MCCLLWRIYEMHLALSLKSGCGNNRRRDDWAEKRRHRELRRRGRVNCYSPVTSDGRTSALYRRAPAIPWFGHCLVQLLGGFWSPEARRGTKRLASPRSRFIVAHEKWQKGLFGWTVGRFSTPSPTNRIHANWFALGFWSRSSRAARFLATSATAWRIHTIWAPAIPAISSSPSPMVVP
jgi:hypothetical protein